MPDTDNTFKNWPPELLEAYGRLSLPSLYDVVLANEKLAAEMRQQSKDLRHVYEVLQEVRLQLENMEELSDDSSEENEEETPGAPLTKIHLEEGEEEGYYPAWEVDLMRQAQELEQRQLEDVFVGTVDVIFHLLEHTQETAAQVTEMIAKAKTQIPFDNIVHRFESQNENIQNIRQQLMAHLCDLKIELIIPFAGDAVHEEIQRVVERVPNSHPKRQNTIAKVIRIGYRRQGELVRPADISVYHSV